MVSLNCKIEVELIERMQSILSLSPINKYRPVRGSWDISGMACIIPLQV